MKSYEELLVWQKSMDLVLAVYRGTASFPSHEVYGLTAQIRKCTVSIPSNIAEGHSRSSTGDFLRFLSIARGSVSELETQLMIAARLGYLDDDAGKTLLEQASEIGKMITGLRKSLSDAS